MFGKPTPALKKHVNDTAHAAASVFPLLNDEELAALANDIKENGLNQPVLRDTVGRIIDGRNRLIACELAGVAPRYEDIADSVEVPTLITSLNLHRRDLSTSQRAAIAAELANATRGGAQSAKLPIAVWQDKAAAIMKVSPRSLRKASKIRAADPALHEEVKSGARSLEDASRVVQTSSAARSRKSVPCRPAPSGNAFAALIRELAQIDGKLTDADPGLLRQLEQSLRAAADAVARHLESV